MDIIVLFFLCKYIYKKAVKKGLPPTHWIFYLLSLWFFGFFIGINIASLFYVIDENNILSITPFALIAYPISFAGFHIIKTILDKKPDASNQDAKTLKNH
jgi:hypothetical protein